MNTELLHVLPPLGFGCVMTALLVRLAVIDVREMILPDRLTLLLGAFGAVQALALGTPSPLDAVLGAIAAGGILELLAVCHRHARGVEGLGFGDRKLAAAAGLWIGWQQVSLMLLVAALSALVFVAVRWAQNKPWNRTTRVPFGPFLGVGTVAAWGTTLTGGLGG